MKNTKKLLEVQTGDIIRVEYGTYNHWVTVIVDKVEIEDRPSLNCKICGHYSNGETVQMWSSKNDTVEIVES